MCDGDDSSLAGEDNVANKGVSSWVVLQAALRKIDENELADKITSPDGEFSDWVCLYQLAAVSHRRRRRSRRTLTQS